MCKELYDWWLLEVFVYLGCCYSAAVWDVRAMHEELNLQGKHFHPNLT